MHIQDVYALSRIDQPSEVRGQGPWQKPRPQAGLTGPAEPETRDETPEVELVYMDANQDLAYARTTPPTIKK